MKAPYFDEGGIAIYHGDCREVLPQISNVDAVLSDPPYGTESCGDGYGRRQLANPQGRSGHKISGDTDLSALADALPLLLAATNRDAWWVLFCSPRRRHETDRLLVGDELQQFGEFVWDKRVPGLGYTLRYAHESAVVYRRGSPPSPDSAATSVLRVAQEVRAMQGRHPHEKPVEVMARLVEFSTPLGGCVLDPFMGSGSTLRAAKDSGRCAIGIEIDERYCEMAAERLRQSVIRWGAA